MIPQSLDYARAARRRLPPGSLPFALAAMVAVAILILPFVSVRQTRSRIDAVTGSMEWQTTWPFGVTAGPKVTPSELELRMTRLGIPWTRRWVFLHNTHRTLFGTATVRECGVAPPIYPLKSVLPQYANVATASEFRTSVGVMQNGTDAQQHAAVEAAADEALRKPMSHSAESNATFGQFGRRPLHRSLLLYPSWYGTGAQTRDRLGT